MVDVLACPVCRQSLAPVPGGVRCARGHAFDEARQGYVNLLAAPARASGGDTGAMVAARARFMAAGHLRPIERAVVAAAVDVAAGSPAGCIVDVGAGPGTYLAAALDALSDRIGIAIDASRYAARRAARAHARAGAVVADVWRGLPVRDGVASVALDVFAPRNAQEVARVLRRDGALVVVTPTAAHLAELVVVLGLVAVDPHKEDRLRAALSPALREVHRRTVAAQLLLTRAEVADLVAMGPSAWHVQQDELDPRLDDLAEPVAVTASVTLSVHRPHASGA